MRHLRVHFVLALCTGLAGSAWGSDYFDTTSDNWGPPESDLTRVSVTNDSNFLNFQIQLNPAGNLTNNYYSNMQLGFQIGNGAGGQTVINQTYGTGDPTAGTPWGQPVGITTGMNFFAGIYPDGPGYGGGVQFYTYDATAGWLQIYAGSITETPTGNPSITFSIPIVAFNLTVHDSFKFDAWTTYSGSNSAYDALDNPFGTFFNTPGVPYQNGTTPPAFYDSATAANSTFASTLFTIGAVLSWNNSGGTGNGLTWDTGTNQNFNDGSGPATFAASDNVTFDDNNNGHYAVNISNVLNPGSVVINTANAYTFSGAGGIGGTASIDVVGSGTVTLNTVNTTPGRLNLAAGKLILGATGSLASRVIDVGAGATFTVNGVLASNGTLTNSGITTFATPVNRSLAALNIGTGGSTTLANAASFGSPSLLTVQALSIAGAAGAWSGRLELGNNALLVQTASTAAKTAALPAVQDQVANTTGGTVGITSSAVAGDPSHKVLAVVDNGLLGLTVFNGAAVNANSILVEPTYFGDSNLDRKVDVTDLGTLATNYGKSVTGGLVHGDFNGDGKVDVTDLGLLATDYGLGVSIAAVQAAPEPTSGLLALAAIAQLLIRRRR